MWTDRDAPRGRLCTAPVDDPTTWTTLIPEDPEAVLEDYAVIGDLGEIVPAITAELRKARSA